MAFVSEIITIDGTEYTITDEAKAAELRMKEKEINTLIRLTESIRSMR